jgi:hypothetical protein
MDNGPDVKLKLETDEDYLDLKRFDYSVNKALERYPDGLPDHLLAQGLCISEAQLEERYQTIILRLRSLMKVDDV